MSRVYFGLMVDENGGVGRLVQAVQMIRSFGAEAEIDTFSDVLRLRGQGPEPDLLCAVISGETTASSDELQELCSRTDWALGEESFTMAAVPEEGLHEELDLVPAPLDQLLHGRASGDFESVLPGSQFAVECGWAEQNAEEGRWLH
jgi:hypothetical protein